MSFKALLSEIHRLPTERTSRFNNSILSHYDRIEMEMDESSYEYKAPEPLDGVPLSNEVVGMTWLTLTRPYDCSSTPS